MVLRLMLQFIKRGSDDHDAELEAGAVRDRDRAAGRYENRCAHDDEFHCPFLFKSVLSCLIYININYYVYYIYNMY